MANADESQTEEESRGPLDASFKIDSSSLGDDETDFARALGFGSDAPPPAPTSEATAPAAMPAEREAEPQDEPSEARSIPDGDEPTPSCTTADDDEPAEDSAASGDEAPTERCALPDDDETLQRSAPPDDPRIEAVPTTSAEDDGWEAIAPRPAAEGIQDLLRTRADEVLSGELDATVLAANPLADDDAMLARPPQRTPGSPGTGPGAGSADESEALARLQRQLEHGTRELEVALARVATLEAELEEERPPSLSRDDRAELEKALEALRVEIETTGIERDHLIDQLAATSGQLVQSQGRVEQLEASLRAARGALIPLPEGERALRAEVIGLRGRLEEATQENVRLTAEVASIATELAIAAARVEDRQHEIDYHLERVSVAEHELEEKADQLEEAVRRRREALDLATRLQAENTELRSTQAALEETLQARDLEIAAREEHLRVTRDGLDVRDAQMVDLRQALEEQQHRIEALEADLERAAIERGVLVGRIERRESRIATLTRTLGRIEEAMGQPVGARIADSAPMARAEWTTGFSGSRPGSTRGMTVALTSTRPAAASGHTPEPEPPSAIPPSSHDRGTGDDRDRSRTVEAPSPGAWTTLAAPPPLEEALDSATEGPLLDAPERDADRAIGEPVDPAIATSQLQASSDSVPPSDLSAPAPPPNRAHAERLPEIPDAVLVAAEEAETEAIVEATLEPDEMSHGGVLVPPPPFPAILGPWRDRHAESLDASTPDVGSLLAEQVLVHLGTPAPEAVYLKSLGGSLPDAEARLVAALQARGLDGIRMDVLDASESNAEARRRSIERAGLGEIVRVHVGDLADWNAEAPCHAILLADVLHAQREIDAVLEHLSVQTARGAALLFVGRVASGPLQLSASALMRLEELWQLMPSSLAESEGLGRPPFRGDDGGIASAGIEPTEYLRARFAARLLVGFGHLGDLVVGPARGFALAGDDPDAQQLVGAVCAIDASRIETESLPPRHGIGVFLQDAVDPPEVFGLPWPPPSVSL